MNPISLLIPCYNAAEHLPRLLGQVAAQTVPFAEVIVYDDGSQDDSAALAESCGATVLRGHRSRGPGYARNRLLEAASCPWVHFHDADDWLAPTFVEKMGGALLGPEAGAACALAVVWLDGAEPDLVLRFPGLATTDNLVAFMIRTFVHFDALVLPKAKLWEAGAFVDQMRFSEDRDALARLGQTGLRLAYVDEPLATWTKHAKSLTRSRADLAQAPFRRWYLHRCYRKLQPHHRTTVGDQALWLAWNHYFAARGREAAAQLAEARRWIYLAALCGLRHPIYCSRFERLLARCFGAEGGFWARRCYASARARLASLGGFRVVEPWARG